ncbi:hypothetical protein K440DRAFT_661653 [Wilcoxina mikolae CBS 423.85]|nr:hypothetical protein K440DRAFT_661653 [Wilcoxina mikolae CBS 423.85]
MTDYNKLTVPKLREILMSRELSTSGLKTELIARLTAADSSTTATPEALPAGTTPTPTAEPSNSHLPNEEYTVDWSDDTTTKPSTTAAPEQTSKPARKSIAALFDSPPKPDASAPAAAKTGNEPSSPSTVTSESAPTTTTTTAPTPVFAANLPTTSLDDEITRRKKRAERFGLSAKESDALKALERQKRFGIEEKAATVGGLDDALPEQQRKRREQQQGGRGGGKRGRFAEGGRRRGNGDGNRNGVQTGRVQKNVTSVDPEEKRKAEERRKRFAT